MVVTPRRLASCSCCWTNIPGTATLAIASTFWVSALLNSCWAVLGVPLLLATLVCQPSLPAIAAIVLAVLRQPPVGAQLITASLIVLPLGGAAGAGPLKLVTGLMSPGRIDSWPVAVTSPCVACSTIVLSWAVEAPEALGLPDAGELDSLPELLLHAAANSATAMAAAGTPAHRLCWYLIEFTLRVIGPGSIWIGQVSDARRTDRTLAGANSRAENVGIRWVSISRIPVGTTLTPPLQPDK